MINYRNARTTRALCLLVLALSPVSRAGAQSPAEPAADGMLVSFKVQGNVWMIAGAGGNVAVQVGDQGLVVVDTGANGLTDKVMAAIHEISPRPIRYIINTSVASQHVGGNEKLATLP